MISHLDDEESIRDARSAYNARKTESTLIAWICSPEWTTARVEHPRDRYYRGAVYRTDRRSARLMDECSGEIL